MKTIIKIILTYAIAFIIFCPLLAIINDNGSILINLSGFAYLAILLYRFAHESR